MQHFLHSVKGRWNACKNEIRLVRFMREKSQIQPNLLDKPTDVLLIVVTFNRPDLLALQYQQLKKHLSDSFHLLVVDNSTDFGCRALFQGFCRENACSYVSLPPNPFRAPQYSQSHGAALNFVFKHCFHNIQSRYIGLIDHDIFPIHPICISKYFSNLPFYGMMQTYTAPGLIENKLNYLWPGLSFFETAFLKGKKLNFLPKHGGDTGSGCYHALYKRYHREIEQHAFAEEKRIQIGEGSDFQADMYAFIGEYWLHLVNASEWKKTGKQSEKENNILKMIQINESE